MISWRDLQFKVCGSEEVDIDRLKAMTGYKNCNEDTQVIKRFWKVLHSFTNVQK